jgi:hypothetical protein
VILPSKHIKLSSTLLNVGAILLNQIDGQYTVTLLWDSVKGHPEVRTFEKFILALDLLYLLGLIELKEGLIVRMPR